MRCENCGTENNFEWATVCRNCESPLRTESEVSIAQEQAGETSAQGFAQNPPPAETADEDDIEIGVSDPMDFIMGSQRQDLRLPEIPDAIKPEPIEHELTLYRDQDVKLSIAESVVGSKITVEALKENLKIIAENSGENESPTDSASKAETPLEQPASSPSAGYDDPSELPEEEKEKLRSTQKIPVAAVGTTESRIPEIGAPPALGEVKQSRGVAYLSGKSISFASGQKVSLGDQLQINDKIFDIRKKPGKSSMFYLGIGGAAAVLFFIALLIINSGSSEIGQLAGTIIGLDDGRPLPGQKVTVLELGKSATTNQAGFFVFDQIPAGIYTLDFRNQRGTQSQEKVTVLKDQTSTVALRENRHEARATETPSSKPVPTVSKNETAPSSGKGTLRLSLEPGNASAFADGKPLGVGSNSYKLAPGTYTLTVKRNGYQDKNQKVTIDADKSVSLNIALAEATQAGGGSQSSGESGADFEAAGNYREAIRMYDRALSKNSRDLGAILGKARCYRMDGNTESAMSNYMLAAKMAADKGDSKAQLEAISGVIELRPNTFTAYSTRGDLLYAIGKYNLASEDYSRVIEMDKRNLGAYYKLGDCFYKTQNYNEALRAFEAARELNFADPKAEASIAKTYIALGDKKNAKKSFEKFKELASYSTRLEYKRDPEWQKVLAALGESE